MRALVVTNMYPSARAPARGSFVRDQVQALGALPGVEVELFTFEPGSAGAYVDAGRALRRRFGGARFDVIHAHFGLTAWPALALRGAPHVVTLHGTDLVHPRSRALTRAALPFVDLVAPVSAALAELIPRRRLRRDPVVLPCGVDMDRFRPLDRREARARLGLAAERRYVLFPADPGRAEKRYDRAQALVEATDVQLLTLGAVAPVEVPLWVNAADAVLVPSERESFGLAVLEALACEVPVLATDVGVAREVLARAPGTYCGEFDAEMWRAALASVLADPDPRVPGGRAVAEEYSAARMAARVLEAWRSLVSGGGSGGV